MTEPGGDGRRGGSAPPTKRRRTVRGAGEAARRAAEALTELISHRLEGVSAVRPGEDDGWVVDVDVLELARIPDTTSLLATYQVELDSSGELVQYRRIARFRRGAQDQ
ncbi:Gas vesicle synthesis protein GvpO [Streptomyces sp. Ag82_O1-12]|uniref:gas vesicle protein GvpO n=1 Tax=unclassified Streptomyces TaxID=2593676 RepID=UPI000BC8939D|nr:MULTISPECIES: gas vesicle protein GvpO [unclassified Streptomyces]SMQ20912.1 Gas vesicle synthesis protein GvpO [Streptomyces sp. Ag82_O1-12]SOD49581.1 Gas vesicle synthesis protein GvpO [Streptomyces sp. Ag82_G6-1]